MRLQSVGAEAAGAAAGVAGAEAASCLARIAATCSTHRAC